MKPERRRQIEDLYHEALQRQPDELSAFLDEACAKDESLRREIEYLLARAGEGDPFEKPAQAILAALSGTRETELPNLGTRLGSYEILGRLGKGGMGTVYRARDPQLPRDVAIKVLPEDFASDADRVARFQREAQVLASLNHSNIGAIYHVQQVAGTHFLVLELVEGETLAERIARGRLPEDEAVEIANQIAEALEAAHEKGIVHRDLKPANIKITPQGRVKVLDFGLAKMYDSESPASEITHSTLTSPQTGGGVILGTPSYMSPEQARGRGITRQTDIWAFGCVLFEMLTGQKAFAGETMSDTIAKILKEEPDLRIVNAREPVRAILERCLRKDVRRRFHDIGDVHLALEEAINAPDSDASRSRIRRSAALLGAAVLVAIVIAAIAFWPSSRSGDSPSVWAGTLLSGPAIAIGPRVSPDGKMLAFQALVDGNSQAAVMNPKSGNWVLLTREKNAGMLNYLSWSKDGTKIYFDRWGGVPLGVYSIPALGGEPRLLLEDAGDPDVLPDGSLVVVRMNAERVPQLHRFKPETGELQPLNAVLDMPSATAGRLRAFPDSAQLVFFGKPADRSFANTPSRLYILDLNSKSPPRPIGPEPNTVAPIESLAVVPTDRSVLADIGKGDLHQIVAIPFDGKAPARVLLTLTEGTWFQDMAPDGSLYVAQRTRPVQALRFKDSAQTPEAVAVVPVGDYSAPSVLELPDKRFLMTAVFDDRLRLFAAKASGELAPFVETDEDTRGPATFAGPDRIAFILGKPPQQSIGVASVKDGRLMQRWRIPSKGGIQSLSASPDGTTLFYSDAGSIWSVPASGGDARQLGAGDAVAFDPRHRNLIVQLNGQRVRLVRMPVSGGAVEPIPMNSDLQIPANSILGPNAVRSDGQIVVSIASKDSWFYGAAVLDPESGTLRRIPLRYDGDLFSLSWNQRNEIVAGGFLMRGSIWHFRPEIRK